MGRHKGFRAKSGELERFAADGEKPCFPTKFTQIITWEKYKK